jgi:hypothetical protein
MITTINKMIPPIDVTIAPTATGQKSVGEPNHENGNISTDNIIIQSHNVTGFKNDCVSE